MKGWFDSCSGVVVGFGHMKFLELFLLVMCSTLGGFGLGVVFERMRANRVAMRLVGDLGASSQKLEKALETAGGAGRDGGAGSTKPRS